MVQIRNTALAGESLMTQYGTFVFNSQGIAEVPEELAKKLVNIKGFSLVEAEDTQPGGDTTPGGDDTQPGGDTTPGGDDTQPGGDTTPGGDDTQPGGDTTPGGDDTQPGGDVTLDGGVVWHKIEGGYVVSSPSITFTVTGSGIDSDNIPPDNVTLQNDILLFNEQTDVNNVHVKGVTAGDTILIGQNTYIWEDLNNNLEDGYELKVYTPPTVKPDPGPDPEPEEHTLPGGGSYVTVDGGYKLYDDSGNSYTIIGDNLDTKRISIQDGELVITAGTDLEDLVVTGVEENATIQIGDETYKWVPVSDNPEDGYGLEIVHNIETLPGGGDYYTVKGGFVLGDSDAAFTLAGDVLDTDHISVQDGQISISEGANISNIHVQGVEENSTIQIGEGIYKWTNLDNISSNGYELQLIGQDGWSTIENGYAYSKGEVTYILMGDAFTGNEMAPDNATVVGGQISLSPDIDVEKVHVIGVNPGTTISIGKDTYKWMGNEDGYELEYVPEVYTLEGGIGYTTLSGGGYELFDDNSSYSIISDSFDEDHISIQDGKLVLSDGIDTSKVHVIGVEENSTLQIGDNVYKWVDTDNNPETGYELQYVPPEITLENGGSYHTVESGFVLSDDSNAAFTLSGDVLDTDHISVQDGQLVLSEGVDTDKLHVAGVTLGDTVAIGDDVFVWADVDGISSNGYELSQVSSKGWSTIESGYVYSKDDVSFTVSGSATTSRTLIPSNITIQNGELAVSSDADLSKLYVKGVTENATIAIGSDTYQWVDAGENGCKLEYVPEVYTLDGGGSFTTLSGGNGYKLFDDASSYSIISDSMDVDHISLQDGKLVISEGIDTSTVHVIGVTPGSTLQIGDETYRWANTDNDLSTGYELQLIPNTGWEKTESGVVFQNDGVAYTVSGSAVKFNDVTNAPTNVSIVGGELKFDSEINPAHVRVAGVTPNDTIQIGDTYYKFTSIAGSKECDLTAFNPFEDVFDYGFEYNYDNKAFSLQGGVNADVTDEQLNKGVSFDKDGKLVIDDGVISSTDSVHIQGLQEGSKVNVAGEDYTLMDTDNNLENGYELVGDNEDTFGWKWSNRSNKSAATIWRHYTDSKADIKVVGASRRPEYNANTHVLTIHGNEIKSITNTTGSVITLAGDVQGVLIDGAVFSHKGIIDGGSTTYIRIGDTLYIQNGSISGITGELMYMLVGTTLTIISGYLDVDNALVGGSAITAVSYNDKEYTVSKGALVKKAVTKRRTIKLS